jgi:hypothetical protein
MSLGARLFDQFWLVKPDIFRAEVVTTLAVLALAYLFGGRYPGGQERAGQLASFGQR